MLNNISYLNALWIYHTGWHLTATTGHKAVQPETFQMAIRAKYLTPNFLGNFKAGYVLKQLYLNIRDPGLPMRLSGKGSAHQCRRWRFDPWTGKIWKRKWQPTPVFLLGKSHGQRRLAGYSPWGHQRVGHELATEHEHEGPSLMGRQPPLACGSQREDLETYWSLPLVG